MVSNINLFIYFSYFLRILQIHISRGFNRQNWIRFAMAFIFIFQAGGSVAQPPTIRTGMVSTIHSAKQKACIQQQNGYNQHIGNVLHTLSWGYFLGYPVEYREVSVDTLYRYDARPSWRWAPPCKFMSFPCCDVKTSVFPFSMEGETWAHETNFSNLKNGYVPTS